MPRPAVALMVDLMVEASMVASMALMASMASMVASRASVVASMASMASMVASRASVAPMVMVLFKWLNLVAAEPKRGDDRIDGWTPKIREEQDDELTLKIEGASTVAWLMASMVAAWMAPVAPVMASRTPIASMASMVASLDRLRLMTEPKRGEERVDGLSH